MHGKVCHKMFKKISKQNYNDANDVFWVFEILSLLLKICITRKLCITRNVYSQIKY